MAAALGLVRTKNRWQIKKTLSKQIDNNVACISALTLFINSSNSENLLSSIIQFLKRVTKAPKLPAEIKIIVHTICIIFIAWLGMSKSFYRCITPNLPLDGALY